jgi:hypothetical protein
MKKIHGIHEIFRKDENGYNRNARLYQDILRYFFVRNNGSNGGSFRFWELAKWLMKNNEEFVNEYKDPSTKNITMSNRIEARKDRIKAKLDDLISLNLIEISGITKASTTDANIDLYKYTGDGCLMAWFIQSIDPEKHENADNQIFKILSSKLEKNGSSDNLFFVVLFNIMKSRGLFGNFANLLRQVLHSGTPIWSVSDLLSKVQIPQRFRENAANNPEAAIEDLHAIIKGLNPTKRKLLFFQMKTAIENQMQNNLRDPEGYEILRFSIKGEAWLVAIEGMCKNCRGPVHIPINLLNYMESKSQFAKHAIMTSDCPHCAKENPIIVPIL